MSRSIVIIDRGPESGEFAASLGRVLGRRVITTPSVHPDEVILIEEHQLPQVDLALACIKAPEGLGLDAFLEWAMARMDVLTRAEHEQVMP